LIHKRILEIFIEAVNYPDLQKLRRQALQPVASQH